MILSPTNICTWGLHLFFHLNVCMCVCLARYTVNHSHKFGSMAFHSNVYHLCDLCPHFNSQGFTNFTQPVPRPVPGVFPGHCLSPSGWAWDWHPILLESSQPLPPLVVKLLELGPPKGASFKGLVGGTQIRPIRIRGTLFSNAKWEMGQPPDEEMRKWKTASNDWLVSPIHFCPFL
jgi:hypothetical protein